MTEQIAVVPGGADSGWYPLTEGSPNKVVPANEIWLLTSARFRYVADATVADRYVRMRVRDTAAADPQNSIVLCGGQVTASQDKQYQFGVTKPATDIADATVSGGPYLVVTGLRVIEIAADAGAPAGDVFQGAFHVWKVRGAR